MDHPTIHMFYVYILKCSDNSYYTGHTDDFEKRISDHATKSSGDGYTSTRLPVKLVYAATFDTREEAIEAEWQIKGWSRRKKEALIDQNWDKVSEYSKKEFSPSPKKE